MLKSVLTRSGALDEPWRQAAWAALSRHAPTDTCMDVAAFSPLLDVMHPVSLKAGESLIHVGDGLAIEAIVLSGILRTWCGDAEGREVTLDFHAGPCLLPPAIGRTEQGCSRVHCEALSDATVAVFTEASLAALMCCKQPIQRWGNAVLRAELVRRADREWALAALSARERLQVFRLRFPDLESSVPHRHIASYLGITPVSLSRLRSQSKGG